MSVLHFPELKINIDDENEVISEAKKLVGQKIRTEWKDEDLKHKIFSGGISNVLIGVYKDGDKKDMVLVRLYGHKTDVIIDRDAEIRNMTMFSEAGIGAKLFATLGNGLAYAFVPGETMTSDMAKDPKVNQALIEMFVRMHKMKVEGGPCLWKRMRQFLNASPDKGFDVRMTVSKAEISAEIDELEKALSDSQSPIVFSHNDLLLGNLIFNRETQKVTFIDLEYGENNYREFDIANHLCEFVGIDDVLDYDKHYPSEEFQKEWLSRYLEVYEGRKEQDPERIHRMYVEVNKFALCAHLIWAIWAFVQAKNSSIEFDFMDYGLQRLKEYNKRKSAFLALK